jgi:hypothetical protein
MSYLSGLIKRIVIFQFIFLFFYLKWRNIQGSSYEFKDKVYELSTSLSFKNAKLEEFLNNPIQAFQIFVGIQIACAVLGVLGSRLFSFASAVLLIATNFIYYNPLKLNPSTKKPFIKISLDNFNINQIKQFPVEFILLTTISLAILTQAFKSSCMKKCKEITYNKDDYANDNKRNVKVTSNKNKKRI